MKNIIHQLCENPTVSNFIRNTIEGGTAAVKNNLQKEIGNTTNKKIIDIACGTGSYSVIAKGEYVGVDLNRKHIKYARKKYGSKRKKFVVGDASSTNYPKNCFDYAFMLSFLHHVSEKDIKKILSEVKRITKKKIIIVDLVPLRYNVLGKFFYKMDQGKFIRPYEKQLQLIRKYIKIKKAKIFRSGMNLHSLIICDTK